MIAKQGILDQTEQLHSSYWDLYWFVKGQKTVFVTKHDYEYVSTNRLAGYIGSCVRYLPSNNISISSFVFLIATLAVQEKVLDKMYSS